VVGEKAVAGGDRPVAKGADVVEGPARVCVVPVQQRVDVAAAPSALVVSALSTWGIALIGPLLTDKSAQARTGYRGLP
jgi:hypothetical protein